MDSNGQDARVEAQVSARKRWEAPSIVLERSLEVSAQGGPPSSFMGPLTASGQPGGIGTCS